MKVLMVTPFYSHVIGGTESFIQSEALKLNEMGVSADVLSYRFNQAGVLEWKTVLRNVDRSKVIEVPGHKGVRPLKLFQVGIVPGLFQKHLKQYDVIHYHNETDLSLPLFSYLIKKPKILHCHCLDVSYQYYKKNAVSRRILKNVADIYVAVSDSIKHLLIDLGIHESKIRTVPNGVDTQLFHPNSKIKEDNVLLFVGRIVPNKGLHVLLKSLEFIKTPVKLVVIGPKSHLYPEYYTEISRMVEESNRRTPHEVVFLGKQSKQDMINWYQRATVFVCPSISEPFGIVNLEALSCGTPVVASRVGGIPEAVEHQKTGILVPGGAHKELADAIQSLLADPKMRATFSSEGRKSVLRKFSSQAIAENLARMYQSLLETKYAGN